MGEGGGSYMCVFVSYALFYFVLHLLCYVLDYHHHHHGIPVGMRSKCSLRPPRKYLDGKTTLPSVHLFLNLLYNSQFLQFSNRKSLSNREFARTGSQFHQFCCELDAAVQDGGLMLMPSACVS